MSRNALAELGAADFLGAIQRLLPTGAAWPRDLDATLTRFWGGVADEVAALHARAGDLSEVESDPAQASELLSDFERAFGLPDPCAPQQQTLEQRRLALLARISGLGGQSRAYFIATANAIGYAITIDEFRPFRVGINRVCDHLYTAKWRFAWRVNAPEVTVRYFRVGRNAVGDPLRSWGNEALECLIGRLKPAQTHVLFAYAP